MDVLCGFFCVCTSISGIVSVWKAVIMGALLFSGGTLVIFFKLVCERHVFAPINAILSPS